MAPRRFLLLALLFLPFLAVAADAARRQALLDDLQRVLPRSEPWENWLKGTGELPPDFDALPTIPFLPDPLRFQNGEPVQSRLDWSCRREELLNLFQRYVTGTIPPPPGNVRVAERAVREERGVSVEQLVLEFGPGHRAKLHVELILPKGPGPFPVFITQDNHRRWAVIAASRGYLGCVYAGADSRDDTGEWVNIWPEHDWTKLTRRAWAASRCIDYLSTRPEADGGQMALTGHSRNGKLSIIAAAFDERISAVISSSSGAGGACSFRYFSERQFGEGIEFITRNFPDWLHPRLRFFAGREEKLPIDMPQLIACVAPRPFLFATALNDSVESVWAIEQSYENARRVYELTGARDRLNLLYREGPHGTDAHEIERYLDWLDVKFGRAAGQAWSEPVFPSLAAWRKLSGESGDISAFKPVSSETPAVVKEQVLTNLRWALGEEPPIATSTPTAYGSEAPHLATMLGRSSVPGGLAKISLNFGHYIPGDVYFPADRGEQKLPVVIWLHPISVSHGYVPGYRRGEPPHLALARAGFVVFAFDQIGHGARLEEIRRFYERNPRWSLLGKTVADARSALDALAHVAPADTNRIWLLGYDTGASAALHVAALDSRVKGVVAVGGFDPMRPSAANRGEPAAAKFQQILPLQPRLGWFAGNEDRIPYDFRELVHVIAPRRVLLFAPRIDETVDAAGLERLFAPIRSASFEVLDSYDRFTPEVQRVVIEKLRAAAGP